MSHKLHLSGRFHSRPAPPPTPLGEDASLNIAYICSTLTAGLIDTRPSFSAWLRIRRVERTLSHISGSDLTAVTWREGGGEGEGGRCSWQTE